MANFVKITFAGDDRSLSSTLRGIDGQAGKTGSTLKGKLAVGAKIAAGAMLGGLAVAAKAGFDEFINAEKISAQTAAALKSTGGAAKVTQKQIQDLAGAIGAKTGIDAEAIQEGQNLLLTFTKIRNEAGAGNDIFNRTTMALADMSTAMGKDAKSQAVQLGKALNDPIKGVSALGKAGVQFTKEQKEQIKTMVEAGDVTGAQKVILAELETQFGGSAEAAGKTFAGQMNKLRNSLEDAAAAVVASLMPALQRMASILAAVAGFAMKHQAATKVLVGALAALAVAVLSVNAAVKVYRSTTAAAKAISTIFTKATVLKTAALKAAAIAQKALNLVMSQNPIARVVLVLTALAAAIVIAYKRSETFRNIVDGVFGALKAAAAAVGGAVRGAFEAISRAADTVAGEVRRIFGALVGFFSEWGVLLLGPIGLVIKEWDKLVAGAGALWSGIKAGWDAISGVPAAIVGFIKTGVTGALEGIAAAGRTVAAKVWDGVKAGLEGVVGVAAAVVAFIRTGVTNALEGLASAGRVVASKVWDGVKAGIEAIAGVGSTIVGWIRAGVTAALSGVAETAARIGGKIWSGIKTGLGNIGSRLWAIIKAGVDYALGLLPGPVRRILGLGGGGGPATPVERAAAAAATRGLKSHTGGIVPGRTGQEVPMTLLAGQRVLPPGTRSAGRSGNVYNVTVNALDPRSAAQAVVEAIRVYERTSGQVFVRV